MRIGKEEWKKKRIRDRDETKEGNNGIWKRKQKGQK